MYPAQYYSPGYTGYMQAPAQPAPGPAMAPQPAPQITFQWVKSIEEVNDHLLAPNTSGLFFDVNAKCFYVKSVDSLGMARPLRIFDYNERTANVSETKDFVTRKELEERLAALTKKEATADELSV